MSARSLLRIVPLGGLLLVAGCCTCRRPPSAAGPTAAAARDAAPSQVRGRFRERDLAHWKQYADTPARWTILRGALVGSGGGEQAVLVNERSELLDGWAEVRSDGAGDGGLVLRFVDNEHYYLMAIRDDNSPIGEKNVELYRRDGSHFEQLTHGGIDLSWPAGTVKTFRFEAVENELRAYADGVLLTRVTDRFPLTRRGKAGVRHNAVSGPGGESPAHYLSFRWSS